MDNQSIFAAKAKGFRLQARTEFSKCSDVFDKTHHQFIRAARLNRIALNYQDMELNNSVPTNLIIAVGNKAVRKKV